LFGRHVGGFGRGPFVIEGRTLLFVEADPGGDACHLLLGFGEQILEQTFGGTAKMTHSLCQSRGHDLCRWEGEIVSAAITVDLQEVADDDELNLDGTDA
jgi:hypothetical protein